MSSVSPSSPLGDIEKLSIELVEQLEPQELEPSHHDFLMKRHGSVQLDPLPSNSNLDPLNWPDWKKNYEIFFLAFHCFTVTFMQAGLSPAYLSMSQQYGRSMTETAYLSSAQICVSGFAPFFWVPLMNAYGRNAFLAVSSLICCALNIGGGFCTTYGQQMALRILVCWFASTGSAAGSSVVADLAFSHERGKKNGWWSSALMLGTPSGPFFMGFVEYHAGTRWIYFTFAIMNFVQFVLWLVADETVYIREKKTEEVTGVELGKNGILRWLGLYKRTEEPFTWDIFFRPLKQCANYNVSLSTIALAIVFCYGNILFVVEMPQTFGSLFHLDAQMLGVQYVALMIGSVIGELLAGPLSDRWMKYCEKRRGKRVVVDRLWISYNGMICVIVGLIVWGVYLDRAKEGHWSISALIGAAIACGGNNIVTTVLTTFAIDSTEYPSDAGLYLNLLRLIFGFLGPFYFVSMFESLGYANAAGLLCGIVGLASVINIIVTHLIGLRKL